MSELFFLFVFLLLILHMVFYDMILSKSNNSEPQFVRLRKPPLPKPNNARSTSSLMHIYFGCIMLIRNLFFFKCIFHNILWEIEESGKLLRSFADYQASFCHLLRRIAKDYISHSLCFYRFKLLSKMERSKDPLRTTEQSTLCGLK